MQFQRTSGTHANDTIKPVPVPHTLENRKINYRAGQTRVTSERGGVYKQMKTYEGKTQPSISGYQLVDFHLR